MPASAQISAMEAPRKPSRAKHALAAARISRRFFMLDGIQAAQGKGISNLEYLI